MVVCHVRCGVSKRWGVGCLAECSAMRVCRWTWSGGGTAGQVFASDDAAVKVGRECMQRVRDKWVSKLVEGSSPSAPLKLGSATMDELMQA